MNLLLEQLIETSLIAKFAQYQFNRLIREAKVFLNRKWWDQTKKGSASGLWSRICDAPWLSIPYLWPVRIQPASCLLLSASGRFQRSVKAKRLLHKPRRNDGIGRFMYDSTTKQDSHKCNRSRICGGGYLDASSEASLTRCSCFMSTRYDLHILEDSWCQTSASIEGVAKYTYPLIMQACATFQACQIKGWQVPYSLCR